MAQTPDALSLGPDGYSRFFVIVGILEHLYKKRTRPVRILDIGGCSPYLGELLEKSPLKTELTILDILPQPADVTAKYIQTDATKTDMPDGAFDVVVSTDTLEHVTPKLKDDFVRACLRLAKDVCIIAAPFETPGVHHAEIMVNDFNKKLFGVGQDWLEEHFEFKKPNLATTEATIKKTGASYVHFGTNNIYSWLFSAHLNLIEAKIGIDAKKSRAIKRHYNRLLAFSPELTDPSYRHFFVVYNNKELGKQADVPGTLTDTLEPETLLRYMHDMLAAVTDRLIELSDHSKSAIQKGVYQEQQIIIQKAKIEELERELKDLGPVRHLGKLRHPRRVAQAIKRRIKRTR
ncbi:MAG TPA: class I SAM-dependent methyltransferase [Magnetospirillaceae bacterium]|nr:class I SAM-dependent methyltransferase [Magnetospirillaceae bacterium]